LANVHKRFKHSGSFAPTGSVTMPYTLCTGPLLLANSFISERVVGFHLSSWPSAYGSARQTRRSIWSLRSRHA